MQAMVVQLARRPHPPVEKGASAMAACTAIASLLDNGKVFDRDACRAVMDVCEREVCFIPPLSAGYETQLRSQGKCVAASARVHIPQDKPDGQVKSLASSIAAAKAVKRTAAPKTYRWGIAAMIPNEIRHTSQCITGGKRCQRRLGKQSRRSTCTRRRGASKQQRIRGIINGQRRTRDRGRTAKPFSF